MEVEYNQLSQNGGLQGLKIENVLIEQLNELPPTFPEPDPLDEMRHAVMQRQLGMDEWMKRNTFPEPATDPWEEQG